MSVFAIAMLGAMANGGLDPAVASPLPIAQGAYVAKGDRPCLTAPFADVITYDGVGLGDPHSSRCVSEVLETNGRRYRVKTTCRAMGDGTLLIKPETSTEDIVARSRTVVEMIADGHTSIYALCPGYGDARPTTGKR